ncbi:hydroxyisourate hydrolase [Nocardioides acrostichi]|uniref:5-hydroxyisourate hydrolase n=1 Tax=Nocardioides acrostichi TaxID=2784339 RepID=A0A930UX04_9ACTN|nr:hydroxyisourate hydrolase [Nocardioides acrostichi]MBF4161232.1 hydroxyisourate hydrolase [Nocardioides acrostichi]
MSSTLSTHVLDAERGRPAAGLVVRLSNAAGTTLAEVTTDDDGRARPKVSLDAAPYTLTFDTGAWFAASGRATFYPEVTVAFAVDPALSHHHVAVLLSPYSYTTYRGS